MAGPALVTCGIGPAEIRFDSDLYCAGFDILSNHSKEEEEALVYFTLRAFFNLISYLLLRNVFLFFAMNRLAAPMLHIPRFFSPVSFSFSNKLRRSHEFFSSISKR